MKSIFPAPIILFFSMFLISCGGYLPSAPSNWSANPTEMHTWDPPDAETLAKRRENQEHLDKLTSEIERLFINHASLDQQGVTMDDLTRKTDAKIHKSQKDFTDQIGKEIDRSKKMQSDLKETQAKIEQAEERLKKLAKIKPPVIFSSTNYNAAMKAFSQGQYKISLRLFNNLIKQNPPMFLKDNIHFGLGSSYFRLKKFSQAQKHFQKILDDFQMGDKRFNSYVMLGVIHNLQGEKSRALYLLDEALSNNPPERMKPLINRLIMNINEESSHVTD
ncbi:MAG: TolA-binding protein [Nitrospinales bacterium]|jgi:TolA-binding protein